MCTLGSGDALRGAVLLQVSHIPFLSKLTGFKVTDTSAYQKGQQLVEDLKEKYETSDHPMVHKVGAAGHLGLGGEAWHLRWARCWNRGMRCAKGGRGVRLVMMAHAYKSTKVGP